MPQCCFAGCHNRTDDGKGLSFFRFPRRDKERTVLWSKECGRENFTPTEHSRVCSEHFKEFDFERDLKSELIGGSKKRLRLKDTAIPKNRHLHSLRVPKTNENGTQETSVSKSNGADAKKKVQETWEEDGVMEVESNSSSTHMVGGEDLEMNSSPMCLSSENGLGNDITAALTEANSIEFKYIETLERLLCENPEDRDAAIALEEALMMELEKEEAKLLLLKKIWINQHPQNTSSNNIHNNNSSNSSNARSNTNQQHSAQNDSQSKTSTSGGISERRASTNSHKDGSSNTVSNDTSRHQTPSANTPVTSNKRSSTQSSLATIKPNGNVHSVENLVANSTSHPPAISGRVHSAVSSSQTASQTVSNVSSSTSVTNSSTPISVPVNIPPLPKLTHANALQNLEQQTLAKRGELRRSVEDAMLSVPLPNPNAVGRDGTRSNWGDVLTFIPNANSSEFLYLVGLEEVVTQIQEFEAAASGHPTSGCDYSPFICADCGTDFTPQWKRKADIMSHLTNKATRLRPSESGNSSENKVVSTMENSSTIEVLCEACVNSVQKKRLLNGYTKKIQDIARDGLVKERELEAEFRRIRTDPNEFEKYHREQERKLQAPHVALYGNTGNTSRLTNSSHTSTVPLTTSSTTFVSPSQHASQSASHSSHSISSLTGQNSRHSTSNSHSITATTLYGLAGNSSATRATSTTATQDRRNHSSLNNQAAFGNSARVSGLPRSDVSQFSTVSSRTNQSFTNIANASSQRSSPGGGSAFTPTAPASSAIGSYSSSINNNSSSGLNPASVALLNTLLAQQASTSSTPAAAGINLLSNSNSGGGSTLPNELQLLVIQSLLAASMQQQQQQHPRASNTSGVPNLSSLFNFLQQQQQGRSSSHHK